MKKWLAFLLLLISTSALADYRMIVPQEPGNGTDIWARIVAREWEKKLGEPIVVVNIPGANDIPGFNKFHNELRNDPKTIMVAHGGNAESYLYQQVDFDYRYYALIGLQNLTIVVGKKKDIDPWKDVIKFAAASGTNPDMIAMILLVCGPDKTLDQYAVCYKDHFKYVRGMTGNERKLAYMRNETNVVRETPASYLRNIRPMTDNVDFFDPGVLDLNTGKIVADNNFPDVDFREVFKAKWGVYPSGRLYNVWILDKSFRDVLQKSLFVDKNNPNIKKLRESLQAMLNDPESLAIIEKDTGHYQWLVGDEVNKVMAALNKQLTSQALHDLVWVISGVFGQEAFYKESIVVTTK